MRASILMLFIFVASATLAQEEKENARMAMQTHLQAVEQRDLPTLEKTLATEGPILFVLPQTEMTTTAKDFLKFHETWFTATNWTLESKITHVEAGKHLAMAIVEQMYREPDRNGVPYYNKMITTYDLKMEAGEWKVFKDHMCSIEKSTDKK